MKYARLTQVVLNITDMPNTWNKVMFELLDEIKAGREENLFVIGRQEDGWEEGDSTHLIHPYFIGKNSGGMPREAREYDDGWDGWFYRPEQWEPIDCLEQEAEEL